MERSRPTFEAQVVSGRRSIFRSACTHRLVCVAAHRIDKRLVHSDGLSFTTEMAAQCFDLSQTVTDACGQRWHSFPSWAAAAAWLRQGCVATTVKR